MSTIDNISSYETVANQQPVYGSSEMGQETFLNLLVTQLQNQDPLDPQDNEAFVAQLAQFSSLEQLTNANSSLESLYLAMASMNNASMTQLLGQEVRAYGDSFAYDGANAATVGFESDTNLENVSFTVMDESGKVVWTEQIGNYDAGSHDISWNGQTISGAQAEPGVYTFAITSDDPSAEIVTIVEGIIDGMSFETGTPVPSMGGAEINLGDILEVYSPTVVADDTEEQP